MFEKDQSTTQTTGRKHKETKSKKVCFSAPGDCKYGENCRYRHDGELKEEKQIAVSQVQVESSEIVQLKTTEDVSVKGKSIKKEKTCRYFFLHGSCRFGEKCKFIHLREVESVIVKGEDDDENSGQISPEDGTKEDTKAENTSLQKRQDAPQPRTVCRFYKQGYCSYGNRCRFLHQLKKDRVDNPIQQNENVPVSQGFVGEDDEIPDRSLRRPRDWSGRRGRGRGGRPYVSQPWVRGQVPPRPEMTLADITNQGVFKLRSTEIKQLKKRFPRTEVIQGGDDKPDKYKIQFTSTDPDWPYDLNRIGVLISFPMDYPIEAMNIFLPKDQQMPDTLRRYVLRSIEGWISEQMKTQQLTGRVQLLFRPFIRWLDRKMEDLFTEGLKLYQKELIAKAAGFEFIPAHHLQEEFAENESQGDGEEDAEDEDDETEEEEEEDESDEEESNKNQQNSSTGRNLDTAKRGTEVKLKSLQLLDGAATLLPTKILVIVQCARCKHRQELATPVGQLNNLQCTQCHSEEWVSMRASMAHQYTSVIGYLDLVGCSAFDLVLSECVFTLGCLGCSKDLKLEGIVPGQMKNTWCTHCHEKLTVASEGAKFSQLLPSADIDRSGSKIVVVKKSNKSVKDAAIQGGKPLPDEGTCKHYKKSFRWFRFPCCGKAYPCDVCHDEKESDHEMKLANRMICGFCAKEQPFSLEKPCSGCGSSLIKRNTEHWEGGKGCRDKIKMSRNDPQKYSDQNKTVSRKAQAKQQPKKKTKIRHA